MLKILNNIIKISIYSLVFLLPLFFLPFSYEAFEINKQYLLFFLVFIAALSWIIRMIFIDKEIRFKKTPLDIPIIVFLLISTLSAIFSIDRFSSLVGSYGRAGGLVELLSLGMFYFLITNSVSKNKEETVTSGENPIITTQSILKALLLSCSFIVTIFYFSIIGVFTKIGGLLPQIMLQKGFNTVGTIESMAVFLSAIMALLVGIIISRKDSNKLLGIFYWILFAAILFLFIAIDFKPVWIILIITQLLLLVFSIAKRIFKENINKLLPSIILTIVSVLFIAINLPKTQYTSLSQNDLILPQGESWQISLKSIVSNPKNIFLGSGIGTFSYDFSKFKSINFNNANYWQVRFDRAGNNFAEIITTSGALGILSYLVLLGLFFVVFWILMEEKFVFLFDSDKHGLPLLSAFLALLIGQLVFYQNIVFSFLFWLILGISMVSWQKEFGESKYSFEKFQEIGLISRALTILVVIGFLAVSFFAIRFYMADKIFLTAVQSSEESVQLFNLQKAVKLNPYQPQYRIVLSRFYLNQAMLVSSPSNEQDLANLQQKIASASEESKIATEISPNNISAWVTRAVVYREIKTIFWGVETLIPNVLEWGIKSFQTCILLEPNNPALHVELGKLFINQGKIDEAKAEFTKALELKSYYSDAIIQLALISEQEGDSNASIKDLENLLRHNPYDNNALFQLGKMYYNQGRIDEAVLAFKQTLILFPNFSNAHYALGVAYSQEGDNAGAIAEFEKVLELNPGNQDVIQKINELKGSSK